MSLSVNEAQDGGLSGSGSGSGSGGENGKSRNLAPDEVMRIPRPSLSGVSNRSSLNAKDQKISSMHSLSVATTKVASPSMAFANNANSITALKKPVPRLSAKPNPFSDVNESSISMGNQDARLKELGIMGGSDHDVSPSIEDVGNRSGGHNESSRSSRESEDGNVINENSHDLKEKSRSRSKSLGDIPDNSNGLPDLNQDMNQMSSEIQPATALESNFNSFDDKFNPPKEVSVSQQSFQLREPFISSPSESPDRIREEEEEEEDSNVQLQ